MSVHLVRNQTYNLTTGEVTEDVPAVNPKRRTACYKQARYERSRVQAETAKHFLSKNDPRGFALAVRSMFSA